MNIFLPERITQAREASGLSKTDLADRLSVSVAAVAQWENGTKHPTAENIAAIGHATGVPMQLLLKQVPNEISARGPVTFRAKKSAKTTRLRKQAQRYAEFAAEAYIWIEELVSIPVTQLPEISPDISPEQSATQCRRIWGLGDRPIAKLGELLESKGIRICSSAFGANRMDAYSCVIGGRALVFLNNTIRDRARCRFDAAHELGHLIRHQHLSDKEIEENSKFIESEADKFASAFLLPEDTFSKDVVDPSLDGFKRLKSKWGVSIQAMVRRAKDLGLISDSTYESHCRRISVLGWRKPKGEPFDELVPATNRILARRSLELLEMGDAIKPWEVPASLPLPLSVLQSVFDTDFQKISPGNLDNIILLPGINRC